MLHRCNKFDYFWFVCTLCFCVVLMYYRVCHLFLLTRTGDRPVPWTPEHWNLVAQLSISRDDLVHLNRIIRLTYLNIQQALQPFLGTESRAPGSPPVTDPTVRTYRLQASDTVWKVAFVRYPSVFPPKQNSVHIRSVSSPTSAVIKVKLSLCLTN
jgi:hypothetical protein